MYVVKTKAVSSIQRKLKNFNQTQIIKHDL